MITCLLSMFFLFSACKTSHKEVIVTKAGEIIINPAGDSFNANPNYFFGTYIGQIPCSKCKKEINSILTLKEDSSYRLKKNDAHTFQIIKGYYSLENNIISLDENMEFRINGNQLYYLPPKHSKTTHNAPIFILNKIK